MLIRRVHVNQTVLAKACSRFNIRSLLRFDFRPGALRDEAGCLRLTRMRRNLWGVILMSAIALAIALPGCRKKPNPSRRATVFLEPRRRSRRPSAPSCSPSISKSRWARTIIKSKGTWLKAPRPARLPAVLVLNGDEGDAHQCVKKNGDLATILGIQVACVSIPGYGKSSGPSRLVGPQAVEAARHAPSICSPSVTTSIRIGWRSGASLTAPSPPAC